MSKPKPLADYLKASKKEFWLGRGPYIFFASGMDYGESTSKPELKMLLQNHESNRTKYFKALKAFITKMYKELKV